jgi:hypothetical protein
MMFLAAHCPRNQALVITTGRPINRTAEHVPRFWRTHYARISL